jgi:hypothetical protein
MFDKPWITTLAAVPLPKTLSIAACAAVAFCVALARSNSSFLIRKRLVSAAFSFGPLPIILAKVSFCAPTVLDASVLVERLDAFKAAIALSAAVIFKSGRSSFEALTKLSVCRLQG